MSAIASIRWFKTSRCGTSLIAGCTDLYTVWDVYRYTQLAPEPPRLPILEDLT